MASTYTSIFENVITASSFEHIIRKNSLQNSSPRSTDRIYSIKKNFPEIFNLTKAKTQVSFKIKNTTLHQPNNIFQSPDKPLIIDERAETVTPVSEDIDENEDNASIIPLPVFNTFHNNLIQTSTENRDYIPVNLYIPSPSSQNLNKNNVVNQGTMESEQNRDYNPISLIPPKIEINNNNNVIQESYQQESKSYQTESVLYKGESENMEICDETSSSVSASPNNEPSSLLNEISYPISCIIPNEDYDYHVPEFAKVS